MSTIAATASWAGHEHYVHRVLWRLARTPSRAVLGPGDGDLDGPAVVDAVLATAGGLRRAGTGPGATVAVLTGPNHPAMLVVRYAAHLLGAAVVQIRSANPRSDADQLPAATQARLLRECGATVLVTDEDHAARAADLRDRADGALRTAGYGFTAPDVMDLLGEDPVRAEELPEYAPERRAVVAFTSGSTAEPRGIDQSFAVWNHLVASFPGTTDPAAPAVMLAVTPLSHTIGPMADAVLAEGGRVLLHAGFDTAAVLRAVADHRVTDVYLAVPHLYALVEDPATARADLSPLRRVIYSGTPAAPHRIAAAHALLGPALIQLYGTTEAGGISNLTPEDHREPELLPTVGRPFPWVEVLIREPGSDTEVPRGEEGEVWVRSRTVMDGYSADPAHTARTLRDGWLCTGDLGHWDRYGYLRLAGRSGQVVKSGGLKIHPVAVESALLSHPGVARAAVYGVRDADHREHVHAAVVPRPGATCSAEELRAHVGAALSPLHAPVAFAFRESLPLTERGKPDTALLRSVPHGDARVGAPSKGTP
ncbi:class I adenylate-forming enzyme family protein [Streptomyces bohaiensis]|uniref:Long-chain fatty acid--CoA ligase n=1 Tax=Streptomyces bohaiensis TaxID=1431344 RepID=A0ABX1C7I9_9ACTN|nr:fatty acid--CoA ligase family protein [Streptomyces bohaiensis]NJQ14043.1 long-chain fatty acid--CoA ligase [Streptomyces bohaiensis]